MTANRQVPTSSTAGAVTGDSYMDDVSAEITKLYDVSFITLTSVTLTEGTSISHYDATVTPALTASLVDGMKFTLDTAGLSDNASAATLNIDGSDRNIVRQDGTATIAGDITGASRIPLEYDSTNTRFVMLHPPQAAQGANLNRQVFTSSGTWTKPTGISSEALVLVECWGGGGGGYGAGNGGGGGGAMRREFFRAGDLTATVTVTIGAGGASGSRGTNGGNTTFGSYLTAYGGESAVNGSQGGGGGGTLGVGSSGAGGAPNDGGASGDKGFGGGDGIASGAGANSVFGGGGGGGSGAGGNSVYGGGGGTGAFSAGTSLYGGNGGTTNVAGSAPGGGGGQNAAGARGECRVRVIG